MLGGLFTAAAVLMLRMPDFPRSVLLLQPLLALLMHGRGARRLAHAVPSTDAWTRAAGDAWSSWARCTTRRTLCGRCKGSQQWRPVGIVSPDAGGSGPFDAERAGCSATAATCRISAPARRRAAALIASPRGLGRAAPGLLLAPRARAIALLTMPRPDEWLKTESTGPRKIELEDLLGRTPVQLDVAGLAELFSGQTVLVTGAGGSIGSELCRQIARFGVGHAGLRRRVRIRHLPARTGAARSAPADAGHLLHGQRARSRDRLRAIAPKHRPAVVFHAAAYKHVPLMEELNEIEALRTNVLGTLHCGAGGGRVRRAPLRA